MMKNSNNAVDEYYDDNDFRELLPYLGFSTMAALKNLPFPKVFKTMLLLPMTKKYK